MSSPHSGFHLNGRCPHGFEQKPHPEDYLTCQEHGESEVFQSSDPHGRAADLAECHRKWYDGLTKAIDAGAQSGSGSASDLRAHLVNTLGADAEHSPKEALATVFQFFGKFERFSPEQRQLLGSVANCLSRDLTLKASLETASVEKTRSKRNSWEVEGGNDESAVKRSKAEA